MNRYWRCCINSSSPTAETRLLGWNAANAMNFIEVPDAATTVYPNALERCIDMGLQIIRYPGGTLANYAHVTGYGYGLVGSEVASASAAIQAIYASQEVTQYPNFLPKQPGIAKKLGNLPVILVANTFTAEPPEILTTIAECVSQGVVVKGVEIGNEGYLNKYVAKYPNGTAYVTQAKTFIAAIKAVYPTMPCGLVIAPSAAMKDPNNQGAGSAKLLEWSNTVIAAIQDPQTRADALILHAYADPALADESLDALRTYINDIKTRTNAPVWLTEWNIAAPDETTLPIEQAYYPKMIAYIKGEPRITIATCHNLIASGQYGYNAVQAKGAGGGGSVLTAFGTTAAAVKL